MLALFFFGKRWEAPKPVAQQPISVANTPQFNIKEFINQSKQKLTANQLVYITSIENAVTRGDIKDQQLKVQKALSGFWKDSIHNYNAYIYYLSEASKLDNSEKSLTFAARLILDNLRAEQDDAKLNWQAETAISLFEKILEQDSTNASAKIGIGTSYILGKGRSGNADSTMKGVRMLRAIVEKDSNNLEAQLALGVGGFFSGQYDKAIPRLLKVAVAQPKNFEAVATLADCYANVGDKQNAIKWYSQSKKINTNPDFIKDVDDRIKELSR